MHNPSSVQPCPAMPSPTTTTGLLGFALYCFSSPCSLSLPNPLNSGSYILQPKTSPVMPIQKPRPCDAGVSWAYIILHGGLILLDPYLSIMPNPAHPYPTIGFSTVLLLRETFIFLTCTGTVPFSSPLFLGHLSSALPKYCTQSESLTPG